MNTENKTLIVSEEFRTPGRLRLDASCHVEIYKREEDSIYEVTLYPTKREKYRGVSTTDFFENFATRIKAKYLPNVEASSIEWFDYMVWTQNDLDDLCVRVELHWNGSEFFNPKFLKDVLHQKKEDQLVEQ